MAESRGPAKYTGSDPETLEGFLRHFVRHCTALKLDWVVIWEPAPPAHGLTADDLELWQRILANAVTEAHDLKRSLGDNAALILQVPLIVLPSSGFVVR